MYNIFLLFFPFEQTRLPGVPFSRTQTRTHTHTHTFSFSPFLFSLSLRLFLSSRLIENLTNCLRWNILVDRSRKNRNSMESSSILV